MKNEGQRAFQKSAGYSDRINPDFSKAPTVAKNEEALLGLLILHDEHRKKVFSEGLVNDNDFYTEFGKRVFNTLRQAYENGTTPDFNVDFSAQETGRITKMKVSRMELTDNGDGILADAINSLKSSIQKENNKNVSTPDQLLAMLSKYRG